jgi:hypothetical protein
VSLSLFCFPPPRLGRCFGRLDSDFAAPLRSQIPGSGFATDAAKLCRGFLLNLGYLEDPSSHIAKGYTMCSMSEEIRIVQRHDPQLVAINAKLARWTTDVYATFAHAAYLADAAIAAAQELTQMPGLEAMSTDGQALQHTIEFWRRIRDCNGAAALAAAGENESLAEAIVAFRLVQNIAGERRAWDGRLSSDED